jgi:STE24 endopeptidase
MEIDNARQSTAREYARIRRRLSYVNIAIAAVGIIIVLGAGLDKWLRDRINDITQHATFLGWQPHPQWFPLQIILYFLIIFLLYEIISLPLGYYSGFTLPHRYGISVMSLRAWIRDQLLGFVLSIVLEAGFVSLIYALLAYQPQWWWLWATLIILIFSVLMANLAPVLLFPLFYKLTPLPEGELTQRLLALTAQAHTHVRGVFLMRMSDKTTGTNAALMGLGNTRRIVLGDTMVDRYTVDEIEVILAHELGHHVHGDIWKQIVTQTIVTLLTLFIANLVIQWAILQQHLYQSLTDPATLPFFFLLVAVLGLIVLPINNSLTRHIEYQADEYALQTTSKVEAFKSAMKRLANQNLAEIEPGALIEFLFYSHPSIKKRLQHADTFARHTDHTGTDASASLSAES